MKTLLPMNRNLRLLYIILIISISDIQAQEPVLDQIIIMKSTSGTVENLLQEAGRVSGITFTYGNEINVADTITLTGDRLTVRSLLDQLFSGKVACIVRGNRIILRPEPVPEKKEKLTITGYVTDSSSGEFLIGATLMIEELSTGTVTNNYGFYSVTLPKGVYTLIYSFIGYREIRKSISLSADQTLDIELPELTTLLDQIVVTSEAEEKNVVSGELSTHRVPIRSVENMPALGGNPDVIKSVQLLPGVTTIGEGSTGFFVRGGGRDQNLILLDEAPVYNPSHFLGFLSVFNSNAINSVTLYKGGIPASYGGRASSVLDIRMKEGNKRKFGASAAISPLGGGKLTLSAPVLQKRGSFIVSGRRTYIDPLLWLASNAQPALKGTRLFFYDLNAKANYTFDAKNRLFVSGYFGRDVNRLPVLDVDISWGNTTSTLRWNHLFSKRLFANFTLIYSGYDYRLDIPAAEIPVAWESRIRDINTGADFTFFSNPTTTFGFGINTIHHHFDPGSNDADPQFNVPGSNALENSLFVNVEKELSSSVLLELGLRWSLFQNIGPTILFKFDDEFEPADTVHYASGEFYNYFHNPEPRMSVRFLLNKNQSLKISYDRMAQYLHLLANSTLSFTAFDVWYPSGPNIEPLLADQVAVGYFRNFKNNELEASLEGFYKHIENQIDYTDFAQTAFNPLVEGDLRVGKAWSYGVEFLLKKNKGKFTGWFSYTWSRAIHKIREINGGDPFPAAYDQPHKIATTASWQVSERVSLGANWVFNTGGPFTPPVESYEFDGLTVPVPVYSSRNDSRLPDYHRLDLSAKLDPKKNQSRKIKIEYILSIYNAYNRLNAFSVYVGEDLAVDADPTNPRTVVNQITLLPIMPTFSFLFKL